VTEKPGAAAQRWLSRLLTFLVLACAAIAALFGYEAFARAWLDCRREPGAVATCVEHHSFFGVEASPKPPIPVRSIAVRPTRDSMGKAGGCSYDAVWVSVGTADEHPIYGSCLDHDGRAIAASLARLIDTGEGTQEDSLHIPLGDSIVPMLCFVLCLAPCVWVGLTVVALRAAKRGRRR
jgi:hypothetical protein